MRNHIASLDGWKGIMSLLIIMIHFEAVYLGRQQYFTTGYLAVDFFFIVSGLLLLRSLMNKKTIQVKNVLFSKLARLYPMYLWGIISTFLGYKFIPWSDFSPWEDLGSIYWNGLMELVMLQRLGITSGMTFNVPDWYVSSLIICSALIIVLVKNYFVLFKNIIAPCSILFIYPTISHMTANLDVHYEFFYVINSGVLRGWAGMCLGVIIYFFATPKMTIQSKYSWPIELLMLFMLYKLLFFNIKSVENFVAFIPFLFFIFMSCQNAGIVSRILSLAIFKKLGDFSYSIYLNHLVVVLLMKCYLPGLSFAKAGVIFISLTLVYSAVMYYLIEKHLLYKTLSYGFSKLKSKTTA